MGWWFDEVAHAGREHLDPVYVSRYDDKSAFDPGEDLALLQRFGLNTTSTVVDLGAGTGAFAVGAASRCRKVVAVDISPAMLQVLADRVRRSGLSNVESVEAGFLTYEHEGEPADFVYCRNSLHHLPDFWKGIALQRVARLLRPGGILRLRDLVYSFAPADAEKALAAWLQTAANAPEEGWTRPELEAHIRDEHTTFSWLLEPMLERAGFEIIERTYAEGVYAQYVCRRATSD